jgi:hypothetical protein
MEYPSPGYRPFALRLDGECVRRITVARRTGARAGGNFLPPDEKWTGFA